MGIPYGMDYVASAEGRAIKEADCENCGQRYSFSLRRAAVAGSTSILFLNNRGAKARAVDRAEQELQRKLVRAVEAVPCPHCGWYQAHMIPKLRRRHLLWMKNAGIVSLVVSVIALFAFVSCVAPEMGIRAPLWLLGALLGCGLGFGLAAIALLLTRYLQVIKYDPNRSSSTRFSPSAPARAAEDGTMRKSDNLSPETLPPEKRVHQVDTVARSPASDRHWQQIGPTASQYLGGVLFVLLCGVPALQMNGFGFGLAAFPITLRTALLCAVAGGAIGGALICPRPVIAGLVGGLLAGPASLLIVHWYTQNRVQVWNVELVLVQGVACLPGVAVGIWLKQWIQRRSAPPVVRTASLSPHRGNVEAEIQRLQGTWFGVSFHVDGVRRPVSEWYRYGFLGDQMTTTTSASAAATVKFSIDATANPRQLDTSIIVNGVEEVTQGIYLLDDEHLRMSWRIIGERPVDFEVKYGDQKIVLVLRRSDAAGT